MSEVPGVGFDAGAMIERLNGYKVAREQGRLFLDWRGATFQRLPPPGEEGVRPYLLDVPQDGWTNYAAQADHTTLLLTDQRAQEIMGRVREIERVGRRWNYALKVRILPIAAIGVYAILYHVGGVGRGGGMSPWLWGAVAGLALGEIASPVLIGGAILHTFLAKGSYLRLAWQGGLTFLGNSVVLYALMRRSRTQLYEGWKERQRLNVGYKEAWQRLGSYLDGRLKVACQEGFASLHKLSGEVEGLREAGERLQELYGFDLEDFEAQVLRTVERIDHTKNVALALHQGDQADYSAELHLAAHHAFHRPLEENKEALRDVVPKDLWQRRHILYHATCIGDVKLQRHFTREEAEGRKVLLHTHGIHEGPVYEAVNAYLGVQDEFDAFDQIVAEVDEAARAQLQQDVEDLVAQIAQIRADQGLSEDKSERLDSGDWAVIQDLHKTYSTLRLAKGRLDRLKADLVHGRIAVDLVDVERRLGELQERWSGPLENTFNRLLNGRWPVKERDLEEAFVLARFHSTLPNWERADEMLSGLQQGTLPLRTFVNWVDSMTRSGEGERKIEYQKVLDAYDYLSTHHDG